MKCSQLLYYCKSLQAVLLHSRLKAPCHSSAARLWGTQYPKHARTPRPPADAGPMRTKPVWSVELWNHFTPTPPSLSATVEYSNWLLHNRSHKHCAISNYWNPAACLQDSSNCSVHNRDQRSFSSTRTASFLRLLVHGRRNVQFSAYPDCCISKEGEANCDASIDGIFLEVSLNPSSNN
jgi:hypothetical protein